MADCGRGKKRVSMKNKKSWRKYIDTKDVDAFLDEKRLEERLGIPFAERSDHELFQVDNERKIDSGDNQEIRVAEKVFARKKERFLRPYKCLQALLPLTAVPDPISKRNKGKPAEERKSTFVKEMEEKKRVAGHGRKKLLTAIKNRHLADAQRQARNRRGEFKKDLWAEASESVATSKDVKWLRKDTYLHVLNSTGNQIKPRPKTMSLKTSVLVPIEAPHPGSSYNPSFEEHHDLLSKVAEDEIKLIKEEEHLNRVVTNMIPKVTLAEVEENWMKEMSQGLPQFEEGKGEENDSGVEECEEDGIIGNPIVTREKKKTLQKRRKIKEAKAEAIQRREAKLERKKLSDIDRLNLVEKEMTKSEQKLQLLKRKREKAKLAKITQPKVLSRHKFEPLELEFNMKNELCGNLRNIKPEGSVLKDRFKRMQERNMVETRTRQTKRLKYKRKRIEKPSYKMGWETKGF